MNIVIRADASDVIGTGHVRRCLVLADALRKRGHNVSFMCDQSLKGHMGDDIRKCEYQVLSPDLSCIPKNTDMMIIDHYNLGADYELSARAHASFVMAIDDMESREHVCDLILDQNLYEGYEQAYKNTHAKLLLGPRFVLLRDEFVRARATSKIKQRPIKHILITMGGRDPRQHTLKILNGLASTNYTVDVVMGASDVDVETLCGRTPNWQYHQNVDYMADLMAKADICIGAGGSSSWERCVLGLPSIIFTLADNQIPIAEKLNSEGVAKYIGDIDDFGYLDIASVVESLDIETMSEKSFRYIDGGGVERVVEEVENIANSKYLRPVTMDDKDQILKWRNADHVRPYMNNPDIIPPENHEKWFAKILSNPNDYDYQIFVCDGRDVGLMGFYDFDDRKTSCEWGFYLGVRDVPRGTGITMGRMALNYAFTNYDELRTIKAIVKKDNSRSIAFHERLGFERVKDDDAALHFVKHLRP